MEKELYQILMYVGGNEHGHGSYRITIQSFQITQQVNQTYYIKRSLLEHRLYQKDILKVEPCKKNENFSNIGFKIYCKPADKDFAIGKLNEAMNDLLTRFLAEKDSAIDAFNKPPLIEVYN
jgi:hypothetical protein